MRHLVLILAFAISTPAWAYFQMDLLKGKNAAAKESSQWTLSDWLSQKSKMSAWDQWLAVHRQVQWVEFNPSAAYHNFSVLTKTDTGTTTTVDREGQEYAADLYIGILSFAGDYQKTTDSEETFGGGAGLRLFGLSSQSTSLVGRMVGANAKS